MENRSDTTMPIFIMIFAVLGPIAGVLVGRIWERDRWRQRLLEKAGFLEDQPRGLGRPTPAESDSVHHALEAMAVEIERIGEGQRFLTRVLAEREQRDVRHMSSPIPGSMRSPVPPAS
ncbi:MAG: hypothetical protein JWM95_2003 [Gemmatimonadetes bacterium]|nr:hypothetical protein [Gemmatimonadota bacterium]